MDERSKNIISLQQVFYHYETDSPIVSDFSLEVSAGEWVTFKGPSGSGKTTLLNIIAGHYLPHSGRVEVAGACLSSMDAKARESERLRTMAMIFQDGQLITDWTVIENVATPTMLAGVSREEAYALGRLSLDRLGIASLADRSVNELSGGEAQRVGIARAIVKKPAVLLADEPTGNLDAKNTQIIIELLNQIRQELNTCVVCVTHDDAVAKAGDAIITVDQWQ